MLLTEQIMKIIISNLMNSQHRLQNLKRATIMWGLYLDIQKQLKMRYQLQCH